MFAADRDLRIIASVGGQAIQTAATEGLIIR
jgi:hypothetical protein